MNNYKFFLATACIASLMLSFASCSNPDIDELVKHAVSEYNYEARYYNNESDALVRYYYANKQDEKNGNITTDKKDPVRITKGTLIVEGVSDYTKLKITLNSGLSFVSSKIEPDGKINPSNCFSFTIPKQQTSEGEIESFNISKSPDNELSQGTYYGYKGEEELEFGIKFVNTDKQVIRFYATKKK